MFKIDGIEFKNAVVGKPKRSFTILDGENAGRQLLTAKMERDIIGTFYNYSLTINASFMTQEEYAELYNLISSPVDSHTIEMPFNNETLEFEAYVSKGDDTLLNAKNGFVWGELTIQFVAMAPQRRV